MRGIAVTLVLPLVLAASLFAPGSALANGDVVISGSGHGKETYVGGGSYQVSGTWSSAQLFGPAGTYYGSFTLGAHMDCAMPWFPQCPAVHDTNCYEIESVTLYFGGYSNPIFHSGPFNIRVEGLGPIQPGAEENSICRPPLPGNPRYINLPWLGAFAPPSFTYGLGSPTEAHGSLFGSSTWSTSWTQPGGPSCCWVDDFTFGISVWY